MSNTFITLLTFIIYSFSIAEATTWTSPPALISSGAQNASNPVVGIDINGDAVAAWVENGNIISSTLHKGEAWSPGKVISGGEADDPQIVVDPNGNATVIWVEKGRILTSTQPAGGSFGPSTTLSGSGASFPQIAVDPNGDVVAIWERNGGIESSTQLFGGRWSDIPDVLSINGDSPQISIGADNSTVVAIWHSVDENRIDKINASDKLIRGGWSAASDIANGINPKVKVDSNGNSIAVFYQFDAFEQTYRNIRLACVRKLSRMEWNTPITISQQPGMGKLSDLVAKIDIDNSGRACALWNLSLEGATLNIQCAISVDIGQNWEIIGDLVSSNLYAYSFDLSVDSIGGSHIAFMLSDFINSSIIVQATDMFLANFNKSFDFPFNLSNLNTSSGFPRIASSLKETKVNVVAVWISSNGEFNNIQAASGSGTLIEPPFGLIAKQNSINYGIFTELSNTISWEASVSPGIVAYLIFRNGSFLSYVDPLTFQYIDHNRQPGESSVYGVAALDSSNNQSAIATISFSP